MSGNAQTELHDAVLKALRAACKPVPIWDHVPQTDPNERQFPYVLIGEGEQEEWDTTTEVGQEHRLEFHIFSRQTGKQECRDLLKKVYGALHDQDLSLGLSADLVLLLYEWSTVFQEPDGITYHAVARYRALTTEA